MNNEDLRSLAKEWKAEAKTLAAEAQAMTRTIYNPREADAKARKGARAATLRECAGELEGLLRRP